MRGGIAFGERNSWVVACCCGGGGDEDVDMMWGFLGCGRLGWDLGSVFRALQVEQDLRLEYPMDASLVQSISVASGL